MIMKNIKFGLALSVFFILCSSFAQSSRQVLDSIQLPTPNFKGAVSVEEALKNRRSIRDYAETSLTLSEVSQILWAAYGVTLPITSKAFLRGGLRTAPSAGGLYPLDLYFVVGVDGVDSLKAGVYFYASNKHILYKIAEGDKRKELCEASYGQKMIEKAPASLVYSATFERTTKKYGERGRERYVCMDLGHSAENVYLQAASLNMGTCAVGAFSDEDVKKTINMTPEEEPLYIMPLGKLK